MFVVSQLARFSATEWHQINLRRALVSDFVCVGDRKGDKITFGRDLRIADAANLQQIVNRKATLLRKRDGRERKQTDNRDSKETFHIVPRQKFLIVRESLGPIIACLMGRRDWRYAVKTGSSSGRVEVNPTYYPVATAPGSDLIRLESRR